MRVCPVTAIVGGQTRDAGKPEAFRGLILETLFGCRAYRLYSTKVVNGDFEPGFTMNLGLKNLGLAAAASQTLGRTLPCSMRCPRGWPRPSGRAWVKRFADHRRLHPAPLTSAECEMSVLTSAHAWRRRPCSASARLDGVSR